MRRSCRFHVSQCAALLTFAWALGACGSQHGADKQPRAPQRPAAAKPAEQTHPPAEMAPPRADATPTPARPLERPAAQPGNDDGGSGATEARLPPPPTQQMGLPVERASHLLSEIEIFAADAHLCSQSAGTWHTGLFSCHCPSGQVFTSQQGCGVAPAMSNSNATCAAHLRDVPAAQRASCSRTVHLGPVDFLLDWTTVPHTTARQLLNAPVAAWLADATLHPSELPQEPVTNDAATWTQATAVWGSSSDFAPPTTVRPWDPYWASHSGVTKGRSSKCAKALAAAAPGEAKALCNALAAVLDAVLLEAKPSKAELQRVTLYGLPPAAPQRLVEAAYAWGDVRAAYRVLVRDGVAVQRYVVIELNDQQLWAFVSPRGDVDGAELLSAHDAATRTCYTGSRWEAITSAGCK